MVIVDIGIGKIKSCWGTSDGKPCVVIQPCDEGETGKVGHKALDNGELHPESIVLKIHNVEGLRVILEDMAIALNKQNFDNLLVSFLPEPADVR